MSGPDAPAGEAEWLLGFVRGRDVPCPRCGYNLRDLVDTRCPECAEQLVLRVGLLTPRFAWLVAAMAPGLFSGVCSVLMVVPLFAFRNAGSQGPPLPIYLAELFGIVSFAAAVWMYRWRRAFLGRTRARQMTVATIVWFIHIAAFALLVLLMQ